MNVKDLSFVRGDDVSYRLLILNSDKTPFDLTDAKLDLHVRAEDYDEPVIQLSTENNTIEIGEQGRVVIHFSHTATQTAEWNRGVYDMQLIQDGKRKTILQGKIRLIQDQTRI